MELTPDFSISINGAATFPKDRVISIQTTDEIGLTSDSCEIELDDYDDSLTFPPTEAKFTVSLGYKETGLVKIGTYFVKEISIEGARRIIRFMGNAAPKAMKSQKTRNNEGTTIKGFLDDIAEAIGFSPSSDPELGAEELPEEVQVGESDTGLLTRVMQKIGGILKPTDEKVIVAKSGTTKSTGGKKLPTKNIYAVDVPSYSCHFKETEKEVRKTGAVSAKWYKKDSCEYFLERVGAGDTEIELKEIYGTKEQAQKAASARLQRTTQSNRTFSFSTVGSPELFAEGTIILHGFTRKIPRKWTMKRVEHTLNSSGFVTSIECFENEGG